MMRADLISLLPAVFREDPATVDLLEAFEKILIGRRDGPADPARGLEEILDDLPRYLTPGAGAADGTPDEFVPWLSQWVALSLRADITLDVGKDNELRRAFIANMVRLYRYRGTKRTMKELLEIFTGKDVTIDDQVDGEPFFFKVTVNLEALKTRAGMDAFERLKELAHSVIRLEKPAHTRYQLIPATVKLRIGRGWPNDPRKTPYYIQVGMNTRLGSVPE
jgi:phage tail-like protein